jgi:hypothetical protein
MQGCAGRKALLLQPFIWAARRMSLLASYGTRPVRVRETNAGMRWPQGIASSAFHLGGAPHVLARFLSLLASLSVLLCLGRMVFWYWLTSQPTKLYRDTHTAIDLAHPMAAK